MDRETFRERSRQSWDAVASGWEARRDFLERNMGAINDWIVDRTDPAPGQEVLEIAAGPGGLAHRIAPRVGSEGRVLSSDFSAEMVKVAQRFGASLGLDNIDYRQLDAEQMDLDDHSFDAVVCRFGYMLMSDPAAALGESRRVLRPGGPLTFVVWGPPERNPWAALPGAALMGRGHVPPPVPGGPGIFALSDTARIEQLVTAAAFAAPSIEAIDGKFHYADDDDAWGSTVELNGVLSSIIGSLPADEQAATRQAVLDVYAPFRSADGSYDVPAHAWGVVAR